MLWLEINLPKFDPFLLYSTYRPPNRSVNYRDALFDDFQQDANLNLNLLILDDFNENILGGVEGTYVDYLCSLLDLKQLVKTATRVTLNSKSLIDFILSSFQNHHSSTSVVKTSVSDHYLVKTDIITSVSHLHQTIKCRSFKNFDVTSLYLTH